MERMGPEDFDQQAPSAREQLTGGAIGSVCAFIFLAWAALSYLDYSDLQDRKAEIEAKKAALVRAHLEALNTLSHPCAATMRDGYTSVTMKPERCVKVAEGK